MPLLWGILFIFLAENAPLIARGEHRIEIQRYGRSDPEVSIDILQSEFYNQNHEEFVIRIEDLNKTLNKEINEEVNVEYNKWFEDEFNRRFDQYLQQSSDGSLPDRGLEPAVEPEQ